MDFFELMHVIYEHLYKIFAFRLQLGSYNFTIGSVIFGLFVISCSVALLQYLSVINMIDLSVYLFYVS